MKCPIDESMLRVIVREGIEIDYCPECRGVWLDRGELDKIIERTGIYALRDFPAERSRQMSGHHGGPGRDEHEAHHRNFVGYLFNF